MAATFAPNDAFDYAKRFIKNMPLESVQVRILDDVAKMLWMAAPWRWTVGALPIVTLSSATQDYPIVLPADYLYPIDAYITDGADRVPKHLKLEPILASGGIVGAEPTRVSLTGTAGTTGQARFFPKPGALPTSPGFQMISLYKKSAPILGNDNINTAGELVFDDEWFWVYVSGVLWQAYLFGDDQRAGGVQFSNDGKMAFSGQRGTFEANLQYMREREPLMLVTIDRQTPEPRKDK